MSKYFRKRKPLFRCESCNRLTRDTQDSNVELCKVCYKINEKENEVKACDERKSRGGRADTNPRSRQGLQVAYEMRLRLS